MTFMERGSEEQLAEAPAVAERRAGTREGGFAARTAAAPFLRFTIGLLGVVLFFWAMLLAQKALFVWFNWDGVRAAGMRAVAHGLVQGLRFEGVTIGYVMSPVVALFYAIAITGWRPLRWLLTTYAVVLALVTSLVGFADLQYFAEAGAHLTYEATSYLDLSIVPIVAGAFALKPWLSSASLLACVGLVWLTVTVMRRLIRLALPVEGIWSRVAIGLAFPVWVFVTVIAIRGGTQKFPVLIGDCRISTSPYVNALCLDPMFSVLQSSVAPSKPEYQFHDEAFNARVTRRLLLGADAPAAVRDYPLLRTSPGTERGNGKNVVLFVLESWPARHVGALGGRPDVTPFFDALTRQGAFFDHFFANGLRTPEGMFSILCSFPNQPKRRVLGRESSYLVRWRPLSEILAEVGYGTIFLHGRDLEFDQMSKFLKASRFEHVLDRTSFPPTVRRTDGTWPGYDDEEVVRRAHQEFAREQGRPFLGVIYTMNTHEPFMTPEDYPLLVPPTNDLNRFLNALHYADYTLKVFFDLARTAPYFANTVFILVADHSRTGDSFTLANQHHIPLLIYAPGFVPAGVHHVVGHQLDIVPTVLGLLDLKTLHSSWGQDLLRIPEERGFAVSVAGAEIRWRDRRYLLADGLTGAPPLLCDLSVDPTCRVDVRPQNRRLAEEIQTKVRAFLSLSQTLMYRDRVHPRTPPASGG